MPEKSESLEQQNDSSVQRKIGLDLLSGLTQLFVLLILKKGPQHGYELNNRLEPIYGGRLSPGTIYPLLQKRMEENKDYIQSRTTIVSGRKRRTYVITRTGRIALENALDILRCIITNEKPEIDAEDIGVELLKNLAQYRILFILDQSPLHGYKIVEKLDELFGKKIKLGTIYPSLHRLIDNGYILSESQWTGDREKKVYDLTPLGKQALQNAHEIVEQIANETIFD
ncbi:MAG: helix-turn-helix transcriptional regulator [Asgard group archaeon]|nr:helix-turn-helix transcriptional regulator [Asgard group archaeon]